MQGRRDRHGAMPRRKWLLGAGTGALAAALPFSVASARASAAVTAPHAAPAAIRKAISIWAFPPKTPAREAMKQAKAAGFAGIELAFSEDGEISMSSSAADMQALVQEARAVGIEITSLATALLWQKTLSSDDPAVRAEGKAITRKMLELAQALGVDTILIVPGLVGRAMSAEQVVDYATVWRRSQEALRELAPEAAKRKVVIAIENVWNRFLLSPLEVRRYLEELRSPWVRLYLDVGNVLRFGYPQDWVRTLAPFIQRVHVKDFRLAENTWVGLLEGDMPWKAIVAAFREVGYRGWWIAEVAPTRVVPEAALGNTARAMDHILAL